MSSFYGGKQGRSYKIVEHYDSILDMVDAFRQGNGYTDVGYGEYVIIDTIVNNNEKSNPENGLLYRRGYNFNEPLNEAGRAAAEEERNIEGNTSHEKWSQYVERPGGGAIYVGQIVGPQGEATPIELLDWNNFLEASSGMGQIPKTEEGIITPVSGYTNGEYKDTIDYGYCTLRDINENVVGAYLSFNFPYTVFNFEAEPVDPYNIETVIEEQDDSIGHPYYKHYKLSIPKGKHGQDVSEIGIYELKNDVYTKLTNISNLTNKDNLFFGYKLTSYENSEEGVTSEIPQGLVSYKVVKNITYETNSGMSYPKTVIFNFTDGTNQSIPYNVIDSVSVNNTTKKVTITLSNGRSISYTPREVTSIERDSDTKELVITYNDNTTASLPITEMADIKLEGDNVLIGFRNLDTTQATALFPASMISQADGLTYINFGGVIRGQHILRNFTTYNDLITTYPNGLTGESKGWLVTVGDSTNGYDLYAYDYSSSAWYSIQHIGANLVEPELSILLEKEGNDEQPINNRGAQLNDNGIWLIEEVEKPIFNVYLLDDGSLIDIPSEQESSSISVEDILLKIEDNYKINAVWAPYNTFDDEQDVVYLQLDSYNLNTRDITFISNNPFKSSSIFEFTGKGTDDVLGRVAFDV